jgi:hypothetical protein
MRSASALGIVVVVLGLGCGGGNPALKAGPMPDKGSFSGVYFSPQYGEMHMVQNGSAVVGKYKKDERSGTIQGEADGNLMTFEWTEYKAMVSNRPQQTRGHGYFRYMIDASSGDHVIKGHWGLDESNENGGEWNAYKSRTREPDLEGFGADIPTSGGEKGGKAGATDEGGSDEGGESQTPSKSSGGDDSGDDIF